MKKILSGTILTAIALLFSASTGCSSSKKTARIVVSVDAGNRDSLQYMYISVADHQQQLQSTIETVGQIDGAYTIKMPNDKQTYLVNFNLTDRELKGIGQGFQCVVLPGENLRIDGTIARDGETSTVKYSVSGSPVLEAEQVQKEELYAPVEKELLMLRTAYSLVSSDSLRMRIQDRFNVLNNAVDSLKIVYIKGHPNELLAGYYLTQIGAPAQVETLYKSLGDNVKSSNLKELLDYSLKSAQESSTFQAAASGTQEGEKAPDFRLTNTAGKKVSLSDLVGKGKYVVLDFWGSWCGPCMSGMPKMKEYYAKYAPTGKLEIVGINCGETEEAWKAAVTKEALPWINLRDGGDPKDQKTDIAGGLFGVGGFPTKILLSPDGVILSRTLGESEAFYQAIDAHVGGK